MSNSPSSTLGSKVPLWSPTQLPLYDIHKTYLENAETGPFFEGVLPKRFKRPETLWIPFLKFHAASRIGVAAGPLLNSRWIALASNLGFDLLTYKTIRSSEYDGHPLPNIVFVEAKEQLDPQHLPDHLIKQTFAHELLKDLSITNSFGMPSRSKQYLKHDIPLAYSLLKPGQILIVSVVGSQNAELPFEDDFAYTAQFAVECGAKIIEANFSCPNVATGEGSVYTNPETVYTLASKLIKAIKPIPLIIKVGTFESRKQLSDVLHAATRAGVAAVSGLNTIKMKVLDKEGRNALGPTRPTSGVCGGIIRKAALDFVHDASQIIKHDKLDIGLIGVGGATLPQHFENLIEMGADIAMCATGMMWDPYLAIRFHEREKWKLEK